MPTSSSLVEPAFCKVLRLKENGQVAHGAGLPMNNATIGAVSAWAV
jgi:hypothetical protein